MLWAGGSCGILQLSHFDWQPQRVPGYQRDLHWQFERRLNSDSCLRLETNFWWVAWSWVHLRYGAGSSRIYARALETDHLNWNSSRLCADCISWLFSKTLGRQVWSSVVSFSWHKLLKHRSCFSYMVRQRLRVCNIGSKLKHQGLDIADTETIDTSNYVSWND